MKLNKRERLYAWLSFYGFATLGLIAAIKYELALAQGFLAVTLLSFGLVFFTENTEE